MNNRLWPARPLARYPGFRALARFLRDFNRRKPKMMVRVAIALVKSTDSADSCPVQWCRTKPRGVACLGCHQTLAELVGRALRERPQVLVLGASGLEGARQVKLLKRLLPDTPVLVLAPKADPSLIGFLLRSGARGWLPRSLAASHLTRAVCRLARGKVFLPPGALSDCMESLNADPAPPHDATRGSPRENGKSGFQRKGTGREFA